MLIICKSDIRPPTAPVLGTPSALSSTALSVPMTAVSVDVGGVASYSLERATSAAGTYSVISSAATFPYLDSGLAAATTYYYRAQATDNSGNVGTYSAIVNGTTQTQASTGSYVATDLIYDGLYSAAFAALVHPVTKYVSPSGNNSNNGNTTGTAYATVAFAAAQAGANGLVLMVDGSYSVGSAAWVNDLSNGANMTIPSGTGSGYTVIRAINPGAVTITQTGGLYYFAMIGLNATRVWIDGVNMVLDNGNDMFCGWDLGNGNRMTRCMLRHRQTDTFRNVFVSGVGSLVQDCASYGAGRYLWFTGSGSGNSNAGSNVFRRVVSRMDWAIGDQPIATFAHYGSDSAAWVDSKNTLYANCIDIDGPNMQGAGSFGYKWGSFYHPKHQRDIRHKGCIVINAGATQASFRGDNIGSPTLTAENCAIWNNNNGGGSPGGYVKANGTFTVNDCFGGLIVGSDTTGTSGNLRNRFSDSATYIVQKASGNGAEIIYAHGDFLTTWGESGFDTVTTTPLWPWPYEARIKAWMDTQITKPSNVVPATPASSRQSFTGTSINGDAMTLTRRVWEAGGQQIPDLSAVYTAPSVGNGALVVQSENEGQATAPTAAFDTTTGFLFAAVGRGIISNFSTATVTDNAGNALAMTGTSHNYAPQFALSGTACFFKSGAIGRTGCIVSDSKPIDADEVTLLAINILNATQIETSSWVYRPSGPTNAGTDITVTRPSVLVSVWAGNSPTGETSPQPSSGWTRRLFTTLTNGAHVQMALATQEVTAGTYGVTWTPAIPQGAQVYIFAIN